MAKPTWDATRDAYVEGGSLITVEVKLIDESDQLQPALTEAILNALERIGLQAESYAIDLVPVDTGNLRNSITHKVLPDEKAVIIGTNVEYAPYVELGTKNMAAQPFLRPAATEHMDTYQNILKDEMGKS